MTPAGGRPAAPAGQPEQSLPTLPPPSQEPIPPFPGDLRSVGGYDLFVRRGPTRDRPGQPAVFVHGLGGASTNWTDLMWLLADRLDGLALDLPGFGRSGPAPAGDYRLRSHVLAVIRLIEADRRAPVHLFGNSLGGAVSTSVAALRPDLVRTLTLVSPALPSLGLRQPSDPRLWLLLMPGARGLVQRRLDGLDPQQRASAVLRLCYYDPARVHPSRLRQATEEVSRRNELPYAAAAFGASLRGLVTAQLTRGPYGLWRQAARVQAPTLLVWGRHDRLVHVRLSRRAAETFPDSRLLVLDDAGHVAQMERPQTVARAVLGMLDEPAPVR